MRIVFCGTPDFAIPSLRAVTKEFEVVGVFTQPDRGNGRRIIEPPVKVEAKRLGLPVYQCENISKDGFDDLVNLKPDCIITCAFGHFLFRKVLSLPKYGVINVHGSLLPKYRGASPVQSAVLNGETETGITIMRTAFEMDSGDILNVERVPILPNETAGELFDRMAELGAKALIKGLKLIESGEAVFTPQDHSKATYCEKLEKDFGNIDFNKTPIELKHFVLGLNPWPSAYTHFPNGKLFKIHRIEIVEGDFGEETGKVVVADTKNGIIVSCKNGGIKLLEVQEEGGKKMDANSYIIGHNIRGISFKKS